MQQSQSVNEIWLPYRKDTNMFGTISDVCRMTHFTSMWYLEKMKGLPFWDSPLILQAANY